jgi:hypothetical protein
LEGHVQDVEKPADADAVGYALRLGWQIAELRGRFWRRVREGPPPVEFAGALGKDNALPLEDERTPMERLFEAQTIVGSLAGQLAVDFEDASLSGHAELPTIAAPSGDGDAKASTRLLGLTRALAHTPAADGGQAVAGRAALPARAPASASLSAGPALADPEGATAEPARGDGPFKLWDQFGGFLLAWDSRIQDTLAASSFTQFSAYQLGRGLGEASWSLDPSIETGTDPHGWKFLLGSERRKTLARLLDRLSNYFGPVAVAAVKGSLDAWGKVADDPGVADLPDAKVHLIEQSHVWKSLLIGGMNPQALVPPHAQAQQLRGITLVLRAFWPQILLAVLGVVVVAVGAYFLSEGDAGSHEIGVVLGILGSFGITSAALIAKAKESVFQVFTRMRQLYYTELVRTAAARLPAAAGTQPTSTKLR